MNSGLRPGACLFHLGCGLLLWSSCFVVLYAVLSLGCEAGAAGGLRGWLAAAWLLHLAMLAALLRFQWTARPGGPRAAHRFALPRSLARPALAITTAAWLATLWIGWPVLALPPCAGPGA